MNHYSYPYHMAYYQPQYRQPLNPTDPMMIDPRHTLPHISEVPHHQVNFCALCGSALWWNSEIRHLSLATESIGELKRIISDNLKKMGFSNVGISRLDVSGGKDGCTVSIAHFYIAGRDFWEVVMCSCHTDTNAKRIVDEVVKMLRDLKFY